MTEREKLVRRGLLLNYATIGYNVIEAIVALIAGLLAGSVALVGFGIDSVIEVSASGAAQWRLRSDHQVAVRARIEQRTARFIALSFIALALYVAFDSVKALLGRNAPDASRLGLAILLLSVVVMPLLARAKLKIARALGSRSLRSDARQTSLCAYLSFIALAGVALNALAGWWWADPVAALAMVPIIAKEGVEGLRGEPDQCC